MAKRKTRKKKKKSTALRFILLIVAAACALVWIYRPDLPREAHRRIAQYIKEAQRAPVPHPAVKDKPKAKPKKKARKKAPTAIDRKTPRPSPTEVPVRCPGNMAFVPGGAFVMGIHAASGSGLAGVEKNNQPAYNAEVQSFCIDRWEVSVIEYKRFNPEYKPAKPYRGDNFPATGVNWFEAQAYCNAMGLRLPAEEEWERACKGPEHSVWPYGQNYRENYCAVDIPGDVGLSEVRKNIECKNGFGVYDMSGNVWEWVATPYTRYPGNKEKDRRYKRRYHVLRGGAADSDPWFSRCDYRNPQKPKSKEPLYGFRCAKSLK